MKKSDLYREWARVLDMCEGTKVSPNICWGIYDDRLDDGEPIFTDDPNKYEFAVAILEDKPVFVLDKVYSKLNGEAFDWDDRDHVRQITRESLPITPDDVWSWNPPKKTFTLNGVELPCPVFDIPKSSLSIRACFAGIQETATFNFADEYDAKKVIDCISKLLMDNTK